MSLRSALCLSSIAFASNPACHRAPEPPAPEKAEPLPPPAPSATATAVPSSIAALAPSAELAPALAPSAGATHSKIKHVIVIALENHDAEEIYGDTDNAPYIHSLVEKYAHADDFEDELPLEIPSEPHYVWMEAGTNQFSDVTFIDDNPPSASLSTGSEKHLVTQIKKAKNGASWLTYQEGLDEHTGACPIADAGFYAPKHNPFIFFRDVSGDPPSKDAAYCASHHKPYAALERDLSSDDLPGYVFITPNQCHDMHGQRGCPEENPIRTGDTWLKAELPRLISYADKHDAVIFIAFDEGGSTLKLPFIAVGPMVKPHYTGKQRYTHSSLLKSVELVLGLPPLATVASATDLSDLFPAGSFP